MHTDTLILLTLTQSNFGARFFLLQMNTTKSLQSFYDEHLEKCVNYWFNIKNRRLSQCKRKLYKKHESKKTKRSHFNISDISSESGSSTDSSASEDEIIN